MKERESQIKKTKTLISRRRACHNVIVFHEHKKKKKKHNSINIKRIITVQL